MHTRGKRREEKRREEKRREEKRREEKRREGVRFRNAQTNRQINRQTHRHTHRHTHTQTHRAAMAIHMLETVNDNTGKVCDVARAVEAVHVEEEAGWRARGMRVHEHLVVCV